MHKPLFRLARQLEAKDNLQRTLVAASLSDDERTPSPAMSLTRMVCSVADPNCGVVVRTPG